MECHWPYPPLPQHPVAYPQHGDALPAPLPYGNYPQNVSPDFPEYFFESMPSSSRVMRNLAEKMRRDKLNTHINELATLVPMVSSSNKRMDKTSILRLSATFLRMHQLLTEDLSLCKHTIPQFFDSINWSQLMLDDMDGIMFVVTSSGKIVFVSQSVERTLGHPQLELLGQSFFNITCPEDHDILRKNLSPDQDPNINHSHSQDLTNEDSCSSGDTVTFCGSSCSDQSCGRPVSSGSYTGTHSHGQKDFEKQRRSFFVRLKIRSTSRSVQAQYEYVNVLGHLRVPVKPKYSASAPSSRLLKHRETVISPNDIVLIAVAKPFKEMKVADLTIIEASRDEYVTRHQMDGSFIYSDHRISIISGYLAREVTGLSAFNFMHKDDVGWVLVALRQMFIHSEGPGRSCYRLKTKTGQFIHLRTFGYLEQNPDTGQNESFICINTLITEEEWKEEFASLQQRFTPMIENQAEPGISAIASVVLTSTESGSGKSPEHSCEPETKDPEELNLAIQTLISDVVTVNPKRKDSVKSPASDTEYNKTSRSNVYPSVPSVPVKAEVKQDRPSVLRVNHSSTDTVSVVLPNSLSPNSSLPRRKSVVSHSSQLVESVPNHIPELNYEDRLHSPPNHIVIERTGVLRAGVVVKRKVNSESDSLGSLKRLRGETSPEAPSSVLTSPHSSHSLVNSSVYSNCSTLDTSSSSCSSLSDLNPQLQSTSSFSFNNSSLASLASLDVPDKSQSHADILGMVSSDMLGPLEIGVDDLGVQSIMSQPVLHQPESWNHEAAVDVLGANIRRNHLEFDSSIALEGEQLSAINHDLSSVPHHMSSTLNSNFTQLKAQHKKQQPILEALKQEPLNHNFQQDVGV